MRTHYATLKDVAIRAGTTAPTVSYVLSGTTTRYVSEALRERVLQAARELNYVKSSVASSLKGKKRKMLAVLVPQFANQFFTRIVLGIERVADRHGYILAICNTFDDMDREKEIIDRMQQQRVDGYIIIPTRGGVANTAQLRRMGVPMVTVDRPLEGTDEDYFWVTTKNYQCGHVGTQHLLDCGHRHMAYIGWDSQIDDLVSRERAFHDTLRAHGLGASDCIAVNGAFTVEDGYSLTQRVLEEHRHMTALFYGYHIQARGGIQYLSEHNLEPGKDISVIFIGSPEWANIGKNNFTHIYQNDDMLGVKAAELIFKIINASHELIPERIMLDCTLIEGNTVWRL